MFIVFSASGGLFRLFRLFGLREVGGEDLLEPLSLVAPPVLSRATPELLRPDVEQLEERTELVGVMGPARSYSSHGRFS
jgi:hypothetical protein